MVEKISPGAGLELGTARSVGQRLAHWATGAPRFWSKIVQRLGWPCLVIEVNKGHSWPYINLPHILTVSNWHVCSNDDPILNFNHFYTGEWLKDSWPSCLLCLHAFPINLVVFVLNGSFRQYFSLYRAASLREGERREMIDERKNVQTTPIRTYCKRNGPLSYFNPK